MSTLHAVVGRPASAHRLALISFYFFACTIIEGYYSVRRGLTPIGAADAIVMLGCAALAWRESRRAWRRWKAERYVALLQRKIDAVTAPLPGLVPFEGMEEADARLRDRVTVAPFAKETGR